MSSQELIQELDSKIYNVLSISGWAGPAGEVHENARRERLEADPAYYSFQTEEGYEEGLTYLPTALKMLCDTHPSYAMIAECMCRFLAVWDTRLRSDNLLTCALSCITGVFNGWKMQFVPMEIACDTQGMMVYRATDTQAPPIDVLLNALMEARLDLNGSDFFERILSHWAETANEPKVSATFLDFALRVRCVPGSLALYRHQKVLAYVFDSDLLLNHWAEAQAVIEAVASRSFQNAIAGLV